MKLLLVLSVILAYTLCQEEVLLAPCIGGAQMNGNNPFLYGRFECEFKGIEGSGIISTFYSYNPPADFSDSARRELAWELFGKNPMAAQRTFVFYDNNQLNFNGATFYLNDSATDDYHIFAYDWLPGSITWYIDGIPLLVDTTPVEDGIAQNIRFSIWGSNEGFAGNGINYSVLPRKARFNWVKHYPTFDNVSISAEPDFVENFNYYDSTRWSLVDNVPKGNVQIYSRNAEVVDGELVMTMNIEEANETTAILLTSEPFFQQDPPQAWGTNLAGGGNFYFGSAGGLDNKTGFFADVTYSGPDSWSMQLFQPISVVAGYSYEITLVAMTSQPNTSRSLKVVTDRGPDSGYARLGAGDVVFTMTDTWKTYKICFISGVTDSTSRLILEFGNGFVNANLGFYVRQFQLEQIEFATKQRLTTGSFTTSPATTAGITTGSMTSGGVTTGNPGLTTGRQRFTTGVFTTAAEPEFSSSNPANSLIANIVLIVFVYLMSI